MGVGMLLGHIKFVSMLVSSGWRQSIFLMNLLFVWFTFDAFQDDFEKHSWLSTRSRWR